LRCYCLLSHHPVFELHFDVIQHILAQERLQHMLGAAGGPDSMCGAADVIQVLDAFLQVKVPQAGEGLIFEPLPSFPPSHFDCPMGDDSNRHGLSEMHAKMLAHWGLVTLFTKLRLDTIMQLLCSILMERSVVVICSDLGALSAAMLSLLPLLRPFRWQGMFCPVLPDELHDFLDSPVPLLVGVQGLPTVSLANNYLVYVSLDSDLVECSADQPIPPLANQAQLKQKLQGFQERLLGGKLGSPHIAEGLTKEDQAAIVDGILTVMKLYYISLLDMLQARAIMSAAGQDDDGEITSGMLRKRVASAVPREDRAFMSGFLETQILHALCTELYHQPAGDGGGGG